MNKKTLLPLAFVPLAATNLQAQSNMQIEHADKRPNIILFMVDDMGWQDTSLPFWTQKTHYNELYETPNMERLAKQGMMFTQAYANSISSPTRCSLITGTNAARHRVTNWTLQKNTMTDRKDSILAVPDWNYNGVSQVSGTNHTFVGTSFVQLLKNSGYHTIHCGKPIRSDRYSRGRSASLGIRGKYCRTCGRWTCQLPGRRELRTYQRWESGITDVCSRIREILGNGNLCN